MRRALAGLACLALAGTIGVVAVAQAAVILPSITLLPACGPVGSTVSVTGANFQASGAAVTVTFDPGGSPASSVNAPVSATGGFTAALAVPIRALRSAPYQVVATQPVAGGIANGQLRAAVNFSLPCLTLTADPSCGSVGDRIVIRGTGWRPDVAVLIAFTPPAGSKPETSAVPGQDTTFAVVIAVPNRPPGTYAVEATQAAPPAALALPAVAMRAVFLIPCLKAAIRLIPSVGPPGTVTTVIGTGFPVGAVVKLSWSQGIPLNTPSITIGSGQSFEMILLIYPHDELGLRHLRAGPDLNVPNAPLFNIASADFLVVQGTAQPHDFSWRR